jgi:hypothetical protein
MAGAVDRLIAARPQLLRVATAGEALGLGGRELLHAGPPLADPCDPPPVLLSSAVMTALHEGWAGSAEDAEAQVRRGRLRLSPAQSRGCVVPLAAVVSATTPLFAVGEAGGPVVLAPVSTLGGPDTRMGMRDPALLPRLRERDAQQAPVWRRLLAAHGPLPLLPLAAQGLAHGDDLHSRTSAANEALAGWAASCGEPALAQALTATPLFFLTLWMAASAAVLRAAEPGGAPTLVTRGGGNGERFAIALAADPERWTTTAAEPPQGRRLDTAGDAVVCGAIGDSAVIDLLGCGGLALAGAPEPLQAFDGHLPADHATLAEALLAAPHPLLQRPVALDAARVVATGRPPLVALAMLGADGRRGFVGRGLYRPPLSLFAQAVHGHA